MFNLEYSYLSLPTTFYQLVKPSLFNKPKTVLLNETLLNEVGLSFISNADAFSFLLESINKTHNSSFAQAYAGHQFGNFTKLGDGRAIVLGEYVTLQNNRIDIQLKGSGRTQYSRGGDGMATFKAMFREYLISEAMHHLQIPTSRSLLVGTTGEWVHREKIHQGAAVVRLMKSHIRIGTFEYARNFGTITDLQALTDYTINRLYPEIKNEENLALGLLKKVMSLQIDLVVNWLRVGFVHGVMNTDNIAISGETFDYGPCAFMNAYHQDTVFSSIDTNGRYAFGNQPKLIKWNIARFAEALLPILHSNPEEALQLAQACIDAFDSIWEETYYKMMLGKIGIQTNDPRLYSLVDELLNLMQENKIDYTNTFWSLGQDISLTDNPFNKPEFKPWLQKWMMVIENLGDMQQAIELMNKTNPVFIPRNHLVEQALDEACTGNMHLFTSLLSIFSKPYNYQSTLVEFMQPSNSEFEGRYQTFCGT